MMSAGTGEPAFHRLPLLEASAGRRGESDEMYIQYTGFKVAINSRIYNFQVLDATRDPREFTVGIHSDTNLWSTLKLQDGPGICFERLEQELGRETPASCAELNLQISDQDIRAYLAHHYPPKKTYGYGNSSSPVC
jgi:hypothetical protein